MKKLEEIFNLQSEESDDAELQLPEETFDPAGYELDDLRNIYEEADRIDRALGEVRGLDTLDHDLDRYAQRAMEVFDKLVDIGENVEDRNVAPIYDAASKMMANAITASQTKMDRKLKAIHLQIQKAKVDLETAKLAHKKEERRLSGDDSKPIEGVSERVEISRAELIAELMKQMTQPK
jgi:hypothetical protein